MVALIKLHLKENLKKNTFIIFGILGGLISLLVITSGSFTINSVGGTSEYAQIGYQWVFIILLSSLAGVSLNMGVIPKHREGNNKELLKLHGLSMENQYFSRILGNLIISALMALILSVGMMINIVIKGQETTVLRFLGAMSIYLMASLSITLIVSMLSMITSTAITALFGVFLAVIGFLRGMIIFIVGNKGGLFGSVITNLLKFVPPIDEFGELARDIFFGELTNLNNLFQNLIYLWALVGVTYISVKVVSKYEK